MAGIRVGMLSSEINPSYTTGDLAMQITQNQIYHIVNQKQLPIQSNSITYSTWCVDDNGVHTYVAAFDSLSAREAYIRAWGFWNGIVWVDYDECTTASNLTVYRVKD